AAEAAGNQGKFFAMHDMLFEHQREWGEADNAADYFSRYAETLHLDMDAFRHDFASAGVAAKIKQSRDEGVAMGINGTPTFFLNGVRIANPRSYDEFRTLIEHAAGH